MENNNSNENLPQVLTNAVSAIHDRQQSNQNQNQTQTQNSSNNVFPPAPSIDDVHKWRNILSFWILGMCNNYGYAVMLSAAFDILKRFSGNPSVTITDPLAYAIARQCMLTSTAVLLLADTIPSLTVSLVAPFLPLYINVRMTLACLLNATGFIVVATADSELQAILGIIITSFSSGLGETSMLAYTAKFNRNVISAWSSGTGAAGVTGALTYAALTYVKVSPENTLLVMLIVPIIQLITFCIMLEEPNGLWATFTNVSSSTSLIDHNIAQSNSTDFNQSLTFAQKVNYFPNMLQYVLPLFCVYLGEYFINQGLLDLIFFPETWLDQSAQYRWLQVTYQIGVFVSRSSLSLFSTDQIWLMSILQFVNVIFFTFQAIFMTVPMIWVIFIVVLWEGLLGGCCYVNTFNRISKELPMQYKSFGLGLTTVGQSCGIVLAGLLAIPIHHVICKMPAPSVLG